MTMIERATFGFVLLLLASVLSSYAQPAEITEPTWAWERSDTSTVYVNVMQQGAMVVWRITDAGNCGRYPSTVRWFDGAVVQKVTGTRWEMTRNGTKLDITFPEGERGQPPKTVRYEPARIKPKVKCGITDGQGT